MKENRTNNGTKYTSGAYTFYISTLSSGILFEILIRYHPIRLYIELNLAEILAQTTNIMLVSRARLHLVPNILKFRLSNT